MNIVVKYSCHDCGLARVPVLVPARMDEGIIDWMRSLGEILSRDHHDRSPDCNPDTLHDIMIPITGGLGGFGTTCGFVPQVEVASFKCLPGCGHPANATFQHAPGCPYAQSAPEAAQVGMGGGDVPMAAEADGTNLRSDSARHPSESAPHASEGLIERVHCQRCICHEHELKTSRERETFGCESGHAHPFVFSRCLSLRADVREALNTCRCQCGCAP